MGAIYKHNLQDYINKYNLKYYVETGTGEGTCLMHCLKFNFKEYYSIEIYKQIFDEAIKKFNFNKNCNIILGNSYEVLPSILNKIDDNVLFFLDAHFPGADFHFETYTSTKDYDTRLPLKKEIETIVNNRDIKNDVFIIDDLRIYEDGPFENGNWSERKQLGGDGIDFINDLLGDTHLIERDYRDQGYIICKPKKL